MFVVPADSTRVAHTNNGPGDAMGGNVQPRRNAAEKVSGHVPSVDSVLPAQNVSFPVLPTAYCLLPAHALPIARFNHPLCSNAFSPCALTPHRSAIMWRQGPFFKPYLR